MTAIVRHAIMPHSEGKWSGIMEAEAIIGPIMERHGARCGMEEFYLCLGTCACLTSMASKSRPSGNYGRGRDGCNKLHCYRSGRQNGDPCAGVNRHEAENARVLRERGSDPLGLEFCVRCREVSGEA